MSESEEENFCFYGKALDPFDEDQFPKKRPITVEEQIATDSHGRRRFHGAFTGGFSAGFYNTVGSLEGWTPSEFKSSRSEKQKHIAQNAADFMDDEDMGEFGFAPQTIRATKDYDTSNKRKRKVFSDGPIPGDPVLHTLLTAGNETVGYLLLKNIGIEEKMKTRDEELSISSNSRVYGCEMPKVPEIPETIKNKDYELPEFYREFLTKPKNDTFGLGYVGLDKNRAHSLVSSDLVVHEKNKKLSIRGQAFGVGAFENDDDDIYAKEDMSHYDFEITKEKEKPKLQAGNSVGIILEVFTKARNNSFIREMYPPPVIPKSFTGKHKVRRSRFEPIETVGEEKINRKDINPERRAELLGEEVNQTYTASKTVTPNATHVKIEDDLPTVVTGSSVVSSSSSESTRKKSGFDPSDLWNDRFVTAVQEDEATNVLAPVKKYESEHYTKEMRGAAKLKLFGPLTRISEDWQPCSLLCKRFNVPEPMSDKLNSGKNRTRTKNLIFEYQKHHDINVSLKPGLSSQTTSNALGYLQITSNDENKQADSDVAEVEIKQEIEEAENTTNTNITEEMKTEDEEPNKSEAEIKKTEASSKNDEKVDKIVDITDRLNIAEKGDLFRAVFLSSSESEDEQDEPKREKTLTREEEEEIQARELVLRSNVLGKELVLPKIKPVKEGILSGLDFRSFHKFAKPATIEEKESSPSNTAEESNVSSANLMDDNLYGPKLPDKKMVSEVNSSYSKKVSDDSSDEWVEKDDVGKSKKKKHKKDKSSHKKKHKHKKNKKQ